MVDSPNLGLALPHETDNIDDEIYRLRDNLLLLDTIIGSLQVLVSGKAASVHTHTMAQIAGLVDALAGKMAASKTFSLVELTDVIGASGAPSGYLLAKQIDGSYQFISAAAAIGNHQHVVADIIDFNSKVQALLASLPSRVTARASAAGPSYSTAGLEARPVAGRDNDWATIGFHRPGNSGYSITHVGDGLLFFDGGDTARNHFRSDGRIWSYLYGWLDEYFLGKAGGTLSGTVSFGPGAGGVIGPNGDIRVKRANGDGYIYFGDTIYAGYNVAANRFETNSNFYAVGEIRSGGAVYAGASYLNVIGNIVGELWLNWGANNAFDAINLRIESRGTAYKDTAVSLIMPTIAGQGAGSLGTYVFARYQGGAGTITAGTLVSGNEIAYADANSGNAGVIGVGTWRCMGLAQTDTDRNTLYLRVS